MSRSWSVRGNNTPIMASVWWIRWISIIRTLTKFSLLSWRGRFFISLLLRGSQSYDRSLLLLILLIVIVNSILFSLICCRYINRLVWTLVGIACFLIFVLRLLILNYPARIPVLMELLSRRLFRFVATLIWFLIVLVLGIVVWGLRITFVSSVKAAIVASRLAPISVLIPQILIHFSTRFKYI